MPHLFLTMSPNVSHSPLFQVIYGDELVDITKQFPDLTNSVNCRIQVASDAVAVKFFFYIGWRYSLNIYLIMRQNEARLKVEYLGNYMLIMGLLNLLIVE